jgi:parallel beta-helix repeat protein
MINKLTTLTSVLLIILTLVTPHNTIFTEKGFPSPSLNNRGKTLFVGGNGPGNYSKIQDAINNATNNETIFVYDDSSPYYENIVINKSIMLLGENKTTTIIDVQGVGGNVVTITAEGVLFSGFSVLNWADNISSQTGMYIHSNNCQIVGNIFSCTHIWYGYEAVILFYSNNTTILDNMISHTAFGIILVSSSENIVSKNFITDTWEAGIALRDSSYNNISENVFVNNSYAVDFGNSDYNNLYSNEITSNVYGIITTTSVKNIITKNNFRNNIRYNAFTVFSLKPFWRNTWDANYWNRTKLFPKIIFGVLEIPIGIGITIPWFNIDRHPARKPYNISIKI